MIRPKSIFSGSSTPFARSFLLSFSQDLAKLALCSLHSWVVAYLVCTHLVLALRAEPWCYSHLSMTPRVSVGFIAVPQQLLSGPKPDTKLSIYLASRCIHIEPHTNLTSRTKSHTSGQSQIHCTHLFRHREPKKAMGLVTLRSTATKSLMLVSCNTYTQRRP